MRFGPRTDIHLMVRDGDSWTDRDLAYFWAGYARAQYVIDEMHASYKVQIATSQGLYLWDPKVQYVFRNLHRMVRSSKAGKVAVLISKPVVTVS